MSDQNQKASQQTPGKPIMVPESSAAQPPGEPPAAPPAAEDSRGPEKDRRPNTIIRMPEETARERHDKKYAFWTWLPSQGLMYDGKLPGGEVVVAPMTASEEKILAQQKTDRMETVDTLVKRCLVHCPVKYEDLLIPDMFYLLLVIRNITYGPEYIFRLECQNCRVEFTDKLTIPTGLSLRVLESDDVNEPWEVNLPRSEDRLEFRLLRIKDETAIRRWSREAYNRSVQSGDPAYCFRLAKHIVTVNGEEWDAVKKLSYVEEMLGGDSLALRNAIDTHEFGVKLMLDPQCPACGYVGKVRLPFDREFFRPSNSPS